jgi:hypothetical protein
VPRTVGVPRPAGVVDETDDADGHRIYMNPWAEDPDDEPADRDDPDDW